MEDNNHPSKGGIIQLSE